MYEISHFFSRFLYGFSQFGTVSTLFRPPLPLLTNVMYVLLRGVIMRPDCVSTNLHFFEHEKLEECEIHLNKTFET